MLQAHGLAKRDPAPLQKSNSAPDMRRARKRKRMVKEESENEQEDPEEVEARREEAELLETSKFEEFGESVTDFKKGDGVFRQSHFMNKFGAFQLYDIGLGSTTSKISANVSYDEAATIPVALNAAYVGFYNTPSYRMGFAPPVTPEARGKYAGMPIVILGGASSQFMGDRNAAIQLAKLSGFSPAIITTSLKHTDFLKSLGATHVVDRNLPTSELAGEIAKATSTPLKTVFDSISLKTQETALELLAPGGLLAVVLPPLVPVDGADGKQVFHVVVTMEMPHNRPLGDMLWHEHLEKFVETGAVKPNRIEILPNGLAGIPDGLKRIDAVDPGAIEGHGGHHLSLQHVVPEK
ncbi:hypothetical protein NLJ89_g1032 [Agrocybe chaxingu]|uniref:Alcohol dehydrogenase-like C-terminal domain-containing protein n=1 Tax=Agrocybe chaxingu TaxID=84603 RepID=A0A9W8N0W7_9AGAR|nr:hypothetical protein NLJ89_g1032 [Agrocybe chaxingu]